MRADATLFFDFFRRGIQNERDSETYSTGLCLGDQILSRNGWSDRTLLDSGGFFETVGVNTTKKFFGQFHTIEGFNYLMPVGVDVAIGQSSVGGAAFCGCIIWWWVTAKIEKSKTDEVRNWDLAKHYNLHRFNMQPA